MTLPRQKADTVGRFYDAVSVARDFLQRYPSLTEHCEGLHPELPSELQSQFTKTAVRIVGPVASGQARLSTMHGCVTDYAMRSRDIASFPIRLIPVPPEALPNITGDDGERVDPERIIRSILRHHYKWAEVRYLKSLNSCWRRFALCKEFSHIIMGPDRASAAVTADEQLNMAFEIGKRIDATTDLNCEVFAWCIAIEIMLPWSTRAALRQAKNAGTEHMDLARAFWIPRRIIDMYFDTGYGNISEETNGSIDTTAEKIEASRPVKIHPEAS